MLVSDRTKERNRELCKRFPFLIPRNAITRRKITDGAGYWINSDEEPEYDYEYTLLDNVPIGWRKAFGEQMCQEIMDELVAHDAVDDCYPIQTKEKYGELRMYFNQYTENLYSIINKYTELSRIICIICGKPATKISKGWISPYCDEHFEKCCNSKAYWTIEEYFDEED